MVFFSRMFAVRWLLRMKKEIFMLLDNDRRRHFKGQ